MTGCFSESSAAERRNNLYKIVFIQKKAIYGRDIFWNNWNIENKQQKQRKTFLWVANSSDVALFLKSCAPFTYISQAAHSQEDTQQTK